MKANCLNHSDRTYKLLEKAYGTITTTAMLVGNPSFTLEDVFPNSDPNEVSVQNIINAVDQKKAFDKNGREEYYNNLHNNSEFGLFKFKKPDPSVVEHIKFWFGYDLYDPNRLNRTITYEELIDYIKSQNKGSIENGLLLQILEGAIATSNRMDEAHRNIPFNIVLSRLETHYAIKDIENGARNYYGVFGSDDNTITLFIDNLASENGATTVNSFINTFIKTLAHEVIHQQTVFQYEHNPKFGRDINELFEIAQDYTNDLPEGYFYGMTNPKEFMAEVMTNHDFQVFLSRIPYRGKDIGTHMSIWDRFIQLINDILFIKGGVAYSDSLLAATITSITNRIETARASNERILNEVSPKKGVKQFPLIASVSKATEASVMSYWQNLGVITKTKFQDQFWVRKTSHDQLLKHIGYLTVDNNRAVARYGVLKFFITRTEHSAVVEVNPEYVTLRNTAKPLYKLSEEGGKLRDMNIAKKFLEDRFGEDIGIDIFNDTQRIGDDFAHGYFNKAGLHIWNSSMPGTEYHEAFHVVFRLYNTESQQKQLLAEAKQKYGESLSDLELEEKMADDLMVYIQTKQAVKPSQFGKIVDFFVHLYNYLSSYASNKRTIKQIYSQIYSNQINKKFKRSLDSLDTFEVYKRVRGFSSQHTEQILNFATGMIVKKKAAALKLNSKKNRDVIFFKETKNWFFQNAFSTKEGKNITNEMSAQLFPAWDAYNKSMIEHAQAVKDNLPEEDIKRLDSRRQIFARAYKERRETLGIIKVSPHGPTQEQAEKNHKVFLLIYNTWGSTIDQKLPKAENVAEVGWEELIRSNLRNYGLNAVQRKTIEDNEDNEIDLNESEASLEKIYNLSHLKENLKNKLSTEVRIFLRLIETDNVNFLGQKMLVDYDELYLDVVLALVRNNSAGYDTSKFMGMIAALNALRISKPHLGKVADALLEREKTDPNFASKFYSTFAQVYHKFITISQERSITYLDKAKDKTKALVEITFKIFESNRNNLTERLTKQWQVNAIASANKPNNRAIYKENDKQELVVNKKQVIKAVGLYNRLIDNTIAYEDKADILSKFLEIFGVDISTNHIEAYLQIGDSVNKKRVTDQVLLNKLIEGFNQKDKTLFDILHHFANVKQDRKVTIEPTQINETVVDVHSSLSSVWKRFADIEKLFAVTDGGSFPNSQGKQIYPMNLGSTLSEFFSDLKNGIITDQSKSEFYKDKAFVPDPDNNDTKSILLRLFENEFVRARFESYDFDAYKRRNEDVAKFDYASLNDQNSLLVRVNAFLNNNDDIFSLFVVPTLADRERMEFIKLPRFKAYESLGINMTEAHVIRGYIEQDMQRIWQARRDIKNLKEEELIEGYHYKKGTKNKRDASGNAFKFWNLYGIPYDMTFQKEDGSFYTTNQTEETEFGKKNTKVPITLNMSEEVFKSIPQEVRDQAINKIVNDYFKHIEDMVDHQINDMIKFGLISGTYTAAHVDENTGVPLPAQFIGYNKKGEVVTTVKQMEHTINKEALRRYGSEHNNNLTEVIHSLARDYVFNTIIATNELTKFTRGNRGFAKNYEDFSKRMGPLETPGIKLVQQGELPSHSEWGMMEYYNEATIYDVTNNYDDADKLVASLKKILPKDKQDYADSYARDTVNKTDSFGVISLDMGRGILQGMGIWTDSHDQAYKNYQEGKEFKDNEGKMPPLMPIKSYYDVMVNQNGTMSPILIKNSYQILIRDYAKDHPNVMRLLEKMENKDNPVHAVNSVSARKLERHGMADITSENYTLVVSKLPSKNLRIPQLIPNKHDKTLMGSQWRKEIISNIHQLANYEVDGEKMNGKKVFDTFGNVMDAMIKHDYEKLMSDLKFDTVVALEKIRDAEKDVVKKAIAHNNLKEAQLNFLKELRKTLQESVIDRDLSENYTRALDIILDTDTDMYRFKIPLSFPAYGKKFNQIIFSIFRNRVMQQKISGITAVQIAELGGWAEQGTDSKVKPLEFIHGKDNKIVAAECAIKWHIAEMFGIKAGQKLDSIPDNLRRIIGYRIPTQGKNSMLPLVIKYVLPDSYEHAVLVPGEITTQMGSDFDIDKMFLMQPNIQYKNIDRYIDKVVYEYMTENDMDKKTFWSDEVKKFKQNYQTTKTVDEDIILNEKQQVIKEAIDEFFKGNIAKNNIDVQTIKPDWNAINTRSPQTREQLENAIFEMAWGILMNKENLAEIIEARDDNVLKKQAEFFKEQSGLNEDLDFNYPGTEQELEMRNKAGAVGIGTYANFLSGHNISQYTEIEFDPISINYDTIIVDENGDEILDSKEKPKLSKRDSFTLSSIGGVEDIFGGMIASNISRHLGAAVDNAKNPFMYYINDNTVTSNATGFLLTLGLNDEGTTWLRMQPLVKTFTEYVKQNNSYPQEYDDIVDEILEKAELLGIEKPDKTTTDLHIRIIKNENGDYVDFTGPTTPEEDVANLVNFVKFLKKGAELVRLNKVLMADRIGDMSSLSAIQNYEDLRNVVNNKTASIEGLNGAYPIMNSFYKYGIDGTRLFFTKSGLFVNTLTERTRNIIQNSLGREIIDSKVYDRLHQAILYFIFQIQPENRHIFTKSKFNELFNSSDNLVVRWNKLGEDAYVIERNKDGSEKRKVYVLAGSRFFSNWQEKLSKDTPYKVLKFSTSLGMTSDQKNLMVDNLYDMLLDPRIFSEDEVVMKEIQRFAQDLIYANFWQFGFSSQGTSIIDLIPHDEFEKGNFMKIISSAIEVNLDDFHSPDLFMDNFVANNSNMEKFLLTLKIGKKAIKTDEGFKIRNKDNRSPLSDMIPITYYKVYNKEGDVDVYKFESNDKDYSYYKPLPKKGIAFQFKEYIVYDDTQGLSDELVPNTIMQNYEAINEANVTELSDVQTLNQMDAADDAAIIDNVSTVDQVKEIKKLGDISQFMMKLTKDKRIIFREAIVNENTEVICKFE